MTLQERIMPDMKTAMKAKDKAALRTLRAVKAEILLAKTDGSGKELTDADEIKLIQKLIKQRKDSLSVYETQGREDLAEPEREEIAVLTKYLPEQMDEAAITALLKTVIEKVGASSMKDMGKVMGMASKQLAGKADNSLVAKLVKQLLG